MLQPIHQIKITNFSIENYELLIDVNLKGNIILYRNALIKKITDNNECHIAISLISSWISRSCLQLELTDLTKAGLINLAESLYFDLKKNNFKISVINPGFIKSESTNLNTFPMPFLKSSEFAADKIYKGLTGKYKFEIFFPWFFLILLKFIRILPYKFIFLLN